MNKKDQRIAIAEACGWNCDPDEEYGGWIIPVDKLPEGTTHIVVSRG